MIEYNVHSIMQGFHRKNLYSHSKVSQRKNFHAEPRTGGDKHERWMSKHEKWTSQHGQLTSKHEKWTSGNVDELPSVNFCAMPVFKQICDVFLGTFHHMKPAVDIDGDGFSFINSAR